MRKPIKWYREVGNPRAMRKRALEEANWHLIQWADYGDVAELNRAIIILRENA